MDDDDRRDVCVLIPTYNEAATIGDIVEGFVEQGYTNVLVVDGHSTDGTRDIAADAGARVVEQTGDGRGSGKGQAVRQGIEMVEVPYVLMLDGDGTYRPEEADRMVKPLVDGRAEHVIGDRFANMLPRAMPRLNQFGNRLINLAFRSIHGQDFEDILSGYRAFSRESVSRLNLTAEGFAIETELSVECVKHSVAVEVVPITYAPRPDESETNLHPIRDGGRIVFALYRLAKTSNPLFYFGSAGAASIAVGVFVALWVAYEWFLVNESHEVIATVAGVAVLMGVQLIVFGVLSDMIVSLHREQLRRLRQVERRVDGVRDADSREGEPPDLTSARDAGSPRDRGGDPPADPVDVPGSDGDDDAPTEATTGTDRGGDSLDD